MDNALKLDVLLPDNIDSEKITQKVAALTRASNSSVVDNLNQKLDLPTLRRMAAEQEYVSFVETFLTNKFCKRLQKALKD